MTFAQDVTLNGRCTDKAGRPVDNVKVFSERAKNPIVYTNEKGVFELIFKAGDTVLIVFRSADYELEQGVTIGLKKEQRLEDVKFPFQQEESVTVEANKAGNPFVIEKLPYYDVSKIPMGSIERSLVYTTAATSNNELTSNYNVRGGSYDENLVYVNGFLIYRPFLTRSGQQEGMSFVNSSLVQDIRFSAGGFDSHYGDKLSSVLDITYKTPDSLRGSVLASFQGVQGHIEQAITPRFNYLVGARYRTNGYLLNALPTKGSYNPVFWDVQALTNYAVTEKLNWSLISHFSSNNYQFAPQTSKTDFGTANEAYSFNIYFDGQERTRYLTTMQGTALKWAVSEKTKLDFYATYFHSDEKETFDIQGQYFINELETDLSKENVGDSIAVLGIGTFLNHARNRLNASIINVYHNGEHQFLNGYKDDSKTHFRSQKLLWGVNYQLDRFDDVLSEWTMIDSAGYSLPQSNSNEVELFETIKGKVKLETFRLTSFVQMNSIWSKNQKDKIVTVSQKRKNDLNEKVIETLTDTIAESFSRLALNWGTRAGYTGVNDEFFVTPRVSLTYFPRIYMIEKGKVVRRDVRYRLATGLYYQPPFYREFRRFDGSLNTSVLSQKSAHFVTGTDIYFNMWDRDVPFKFTAEAYYKYMWDVNPYEIDNVRTRYFAHNDATAYAYGADLNVHGQFVEGIESFFKVGFLSTKENLKNDFYYDYFNEAGEKILFGISEDQTKVDSVRQEPGFIPRPTDQWVNFGALIQDRMPGYESFSAQMGLQYGSKLPYGPPDSNRYKDTLRQKAYFRVDLCLYYDLLYK